LLPSITMKMSQEIENNHFSSSPSFLLLTLPFSLVNSLGFLKVFFLNLTWSTLSSLTLTFVWIQRINLQSFLSIFFSSLSSSPWPAITLGISRDFFLFIIMFFPYLHLTPLYLLLFSHWPHHFFYYYIDPTTSLSLTNSLLLYYFFQFHPSHYITSLLI